MIVEVFHVSEAKTVFLKLDNTAGPIAYSLHTSQRSYSVIKPLHPMILMSAA
jgi:hypothetical protein